jgi:hypothetical protein
VTSPKTAVAFRRITEAFKYNGHAYDSLLEAETAQAKDELVEWFCRWVPSKDVGKLVDHMLEDVALMRSIFSRLPSDDDQEGDD